MTRKEIKVLTNTLVIAHRNKQVTTAGIVFIARQWDTQFSNFKENEFLAEFNLGDE